MLNNVVLDLDGTLWQTGASYIYAYHKLCEYYGKEDKANDGAVLDCLGVKLNEFLPRLFPEVEDQKELAYRAVEYSMEYIKANPNGCCFEGVSELLKSLKDKYRVFIVSNCPRVYAELFLEISGTTDCVSGIYTIEKGEKTEHIKTITAKGGKTLFVGDSDDDYLAIEDRYSVLFCYAAYGYKDCRGYAYRIERPTELLGVIERAEEKERQLANKPYCVISAGANQLTHIKNPNGTEYFGFIEYADEKFDLCIKELKRISKAKRLIGPINGNTFYSYRFPVDNFDWKLYPDCQGDKALLDMFLANGFEFGQHYMSALVKTNQRTWDLAKRVKLPENFRIVTAKGKEAYKYVPEIYEVALDAFTRADFYEDISKEDFVDIYLKNLSAVEPDLVLLYDGDRLAGFNFCYEDPEKRFYVCKTTAIRKEYQSKRLILNIVDYSYRMMAERGHSEVLHHFQNERISPLARIFTPYIIKQKRYALMELKNDK